ncbi:MAG TPA: YHS domain-containing protein, partial [Actinomycetota bacterium]|nr:YHS domain-containing protein [Actinomycetota bacterium]
GAPGAGAAPGGAPRHEATDPVCGMTVDVATARYRSVQAGRTYYLCSAGCLARFEADPAAFLAPSG